MDVFDHLNPVSFELCEWVHSLPEQALGRKLLINTGDTFPMPEDIALAILTIDDSATNDTTRDYVDFDKIRKTLYQLYVGDWHAKMIDLGTFVISNTQESSTDALTRLIESLVKRNVIPILLGGSQSYLYQQYEAYKHLEQLVNVLNIDQCFDIGDASTALNAHNTIGKMIVDKPTILFNYANLGYQSFLNTQEEIQLLDSLHFESLRLGTLKADISTAETLMRDADIVSLDFNSIKSIETGFATTHQPNGFDGLEVCALARYAGISDKVSSFSIFEIKQNRHAEIAEQLISQIIWYFIEGFHNRMHDYPFTSRADYKRFIVAQTDQEMVFYQSPISGRWWMEITNSNSGVHTKISYDTLIPCNHQDYLDACENVIPDRWWKAFNKF
ncbi:MAG: formimidoylglutamase [Flavobacteriaceae bacterium]|nr:formimidoylglutamase [Flavobacteriaceae bacterium]